jgi:hypothetical protein
MAAHFKTVAMATVGTFASASIFKNVHLVLVYQKIQIGLVLWTMLPHYRAMNLLTDIAEVAWLVSAKPALVVDRLQIMCYYAGSCLSN